MSRPEILRSATAEEQDTFTWLERTQGLRYLDDFLFFPLLLGGVNLGFLRVNFYIRTSVLGRSLGWRVRPHQTGQQKQIEDRLKRVQEANSTTTIVRVDRENVQRRRNATLRRAIMGQEMSGTT